MVLRQFVDFRKTVVVLRGFGKPLAEGKETDVVNFADDGFITATEVTHIAVYDGIICLHRVNPAIQFVILPAVPQFVLNISGDKKLLH